MSDDYDAIQAKKLRKQIEELLSKAYCLTNARKGHRKYCLDSSLRIIVNRNLRAALTEVRSWDMEAVLSDE